MYALQALSDNTELIFVRPSWIRACHSAQKCLPYQKFAVVPPWLCWDDWCRNDLRRSCLHQQLLFLSCHFVSVCVCVCVCLCHTRWLFIYSCLSCCSLVHPWGDAGAVDVGCILYFFSSCRVLQDIMYFICRWMQRLWQLQPLFCVTFFLEYCRSENNPVAFLRLHGIHRLETAVDPWLAVYIIRIRARKLMSHMLLRKA